MSSLAAFWVAVTIVAMGTYLMRAAFLLFADRLPAPNRSAREALRMLPAAVLPALIVPVVLWPQDVFQPFGPRLATVAIALVVAWRTRSILATLAIGLTTAVLLDVVL